MEQGRKDEFFPTRGVPEKRRTQARRPRRPTEPATWFTFNFPVRLANETSPSIGVEISKDKRTVRFHLDAELVHLLLTGDDNGQDEINAREQMRRALEAAASKVPKPEPEPELEEKEP